MALPSVFLSYPRAAPDRGSKISRLRDTLTAEIQVLTGEQTFKIFDISSLGLGENSRRVQQELAQASFLLPIVQPLLFTSAECRTELEAFIAREKSLGRDDLILPIYYIDCEDFTVHSEDPLRRILAGRRFEDCRHLRKASDDVIDDAAKEIAQRMLVAFRRRTGPVQTRSSPAASSPAPVVAAPAPVAGKRLRLQIRDVLVAGAVLIAGDLYLGVSRRLALPLVAGGRPRVMLASLLLAGLAVGAGWCARRYTRGELGGIGGGAAYVLAGALCFVFLGEMFAWVRDWAQGVNDHVNENRELMFGTLLAVPLGVLGTLAAALLVHWKGRRASSA